MVLDTSVLIDHLRGRSRAAVELIPNAIDRGDELWSSYIVRAELLAGMRAEEEGPTRDLMRLISWSEVDETVSEASGALGRRYLRSHPGDRGVGPNRCCARAASRRGSQDDEPEALPDVQEPQGALLTW